MDNFIIRLGQESDLSKVVAIDTEAFSPYGTTEEAHIIASRLSTFPEGFVVLETEGVIAGYGSSEKWTSEREPVMNEDASTSHESTGRIFCITAMAVKSDQQNKGIGSAILERLLLIAHRENCTRIVLETTHAKDFYLHRGFYVAGTREQMNTTLFVMAKVL